MPYLYFLAWMGGFDFIQHPDEVFNILSVIEDQPFHAVDKGKGKNKDFGI